MEVFFDESFSLEYQISGNNNLSFESVSKNIQANQTAERIHCMQIIHIHSGRGEETIDCLGDLQQYNQVILFSS